VVEAKSVMVSRVTEEEAVEVEVKEPTVRTPKFAAGPVEEPVTFPVRFPRKVVPVTVPPATMFPLVLMPLVAVRRPMVEEPKVPLAAVREEEKSPVVPVSPPWRLVVLRTTRFVVVAVPETTSCVVEAEVVAVKMPAVRMPKFPAGPEEEPVTFPVRLPVTFPVRFPVRLPETETFDALMFPAVMFPVARAPVKVEVAEPVTTRAPEVVVPETERFVVVAVPETMRFVVEARFVI
jgi:hypothetical protein